MATSAQSLLDPASGQADSPRVPSIHIKTSLLVPELHSKWLPLTESIATMEALVCEIGRRTGVKLIDPDGELIDFLDVRLNDTRIAFHPAGLATVLKHDDRVLIRLVPIGGG